MTFYLFLHAFQVLFIYSSIRLRTCFCVRTHKRNILQNYGIGMHYSYAIIQRDADIASRKSKWNYLIFLSGAQVKVACVPSSNCANIYIFINCIINHCPSTFRKQINIVSLYTFGLGNDYIRITKRSSKLFKIYYK